MDLLWQDKIGPTEFDRRYLAVLNAIVPISATICIVLGSAALLGHGFELSWFITIAPGLQGMSIPTAVALILMGLAVIAGALGRRLVNTLGAAIVFALSLMMTGAHIFLGHDPFSVPLTNALFNVEGDAIGTMSLSTAMCFLLLSAALLVRRWSGHYAELFVLGCGSLSLAISGFALLGYIYGYRELYAFGPFRSMAVNTASGILALSMAILLIEPRKGWSAIIASRGIGGATVRRQLGFAAVIPLAGWILVSSSLTTNFGAALGIAALVVLTAVPLIVLILREGRALDSLDGQRKNIAELQRGLTVDLERRLGERSAALQIETSERLKAESELMQAQKMEALGKLTGGVAHDFNNLLTVIMGSTDLLRRPDLPEERRLRLIDGISDTADRAAKITAQLLAFARRQPLKPEIFDVGNRITELHDILRTTVGSTIAFSMNAKPGIYYVEADPSQFDVAILNFVVNARNAMQAGGKLDIALEALDHSGHREEVEPPLGYIAVRVSDSGAGVPPEIMSRVFEPFFTTADDNAGTGLGLSQVHGFAHQSGGYVEAENQSRGGALFSLFLPRVDKPPVNLGGLFDRADMVKPAAGCVLIIEDNEHVGAMATEMLQEAGYDSVWATHAGEALDMIGQQPNRFDAVFSDVVMPGMSGIELARLLRQKYSDLPIILTTGYSDMLAGEGSREFELLRKPYSLAMLAKTLQTAIGA